MEERPRRKSYTMNILAGVTAACVILAVVALVFFFKALGTTVEDITLPSFVGMTVEEAQRRYPQVRIIIERQEASLEYDVNVITEQEPKAESRVKENSEVRVTVSTGIQSTVLSDYRGQSFADVKRRLEDAGLIVEQAFSLDDTVPVGQVIATNPPANTEVRKGDTVSVITSSGSANLPVRVPNLLGKTEVEARAALGQVGLSVGTVTAVDSNEEKGVIVEQSIEENTSVPKGTMVDISISNGTPVVESIVIPINFPAGLADKEFVFEVYCNGHLITKRKINPALTATETFEFSLTDGKINGFELVDDVGTNDVLILTEGLLFADYSIDFSAGGYTTLVQPDFGLLGTYGDFEDEDY